MGISRRGVIIGSAVLGAAAGVGGWGLLADARVVPGRGVIDGLLGRCDLDGPPPTEATPGRVLRSSFFSKHRNKSVNYVLGYPPKVAAGAKLPVCLLLHGLGNDAKTAFDAIGYHRILAASVANKVPPFVLASVDGGDLYWHPHAKDDPLGMLLEDFPVILAQHGLPVDRFAVLGWSMGGLGALVAATEAPAKFVAVIANAPAFWDSYDDAEAANPTAFDSADEWSQWGDLSTRVDKLRALPRLRIECGESDPFAPAIADLSLPPGTVRLTKGCHDDAFWRALAPEQLRLIGSALTPPKAAK